ncbi:unnamed protein product [Durusdinium trenchii]|uniref:Uncharacterized protein n=1 Tax=Durusdinium trenchii TaxID=1381693 RepID=A0ABP0N9C3_9DINO
MWIPLLAVATFPALALIEEDHSRETGTDIDMLVEVMYPGACSIYGQDYRRVQVTIQDTSSTFRARFWRDFTGQDLKDGKVSWRKELKGVPGSAKLNATVEIKQRNLLPDLLGFLGNSDCGKKSEIIDFHHDKVRIQPFEKDKEHYFYQYVQLGFSKQVARDEDAAGLLEMAEERPGRRLRPRQQSKEKVCQPCLDLLAFFLGWSSVPTSGAHQGTGDWNGIMIGCSDPQDPEFLETVKKNMVVRRLEIAKAQQEAKRVERLREELLSSATEKDKKESQDVQNKAKSFTEEDKAATR